MSECKECHLNDITVENRLKICKNCGNIISQQDEFYELAEGFKENYLPNSNLLKSNLISTYEKDFIRIKNELKLNQNIIDEIKTLYVEIHDKSYKYSRHKFKRLLLAICTYHILKKLNYSTRVTQVCLILETSHKPFFRNYMKIKLQFPHLSVDTKDILPETHLQSFIKPIILKFKYDSICEANIIKLVSIYKEMYNASGNQDLYAAAFYIVWKSTIYKSKNIDHDCKFLSTPFNIFHHLNTKKKCDKAFSRIELEHFCNEHGFNFINSKKMVYLNQILDILRILAQNIPWLTRFENVNPVELNKTTNILHKQNISNLHYIYYSLNTLLNFYDVTHIHTLFAKHNSNYNISTIVKVAKQNLDIHPITSFEEFSYCPPDSQPLGEIDIPDEEMHLYIK
ncbi:unnamed protein product [Gordionus sp. m RMFG-2023]|uniref:uncharacterized protein LOC135923929 n=1 Tax=Gordionus sp. m RMFG-2023 TaxID=3053472 RepID=UPI0030E3AACE